MADPHPDDGVLFDCFRGEPVLVPPLHFFELENGGWNLIQELQAAKLRREEVHACLKLIALAEGNVDTKRADTLSKLLPWNRARDLIAQTIKLLDASGLMMEGQTTGEAVAGAAVPAAPAANGSMETAPVSLPS